jgi:hypothetical protein
MCSCKRDLRSIRKEVRTVFGINSSGGIGSLCRQALRVSTIGAGAYYGIILARKDYERWMAPTDPAHLPVDLLKPFPAEEMNTQNNDSSLIEPLKVEGPRQLNLIE